VSKGTATVAKEFIKKTKQAIAAELPDAEKEIGD